MSIYVCTQCGGTLAMAPGCCDKCGNRLVSADAEGTKDTTIRANVCGGNFHYISDDNNECVCGRLKRA